MLRSLSRYVILPMALPGIIATGIFTFILGACQLGQWRRQGAGEGR